MRSRLRASHPGRYAPRPGGIAAILVLHGFMVAAAVGQTSGDSLFLTGIVRDFSAAHPDFNASPPGGPGHYAGSVAFRLGPDGRPVLGALGYRVASEWRDANGEAIAPHFYNLYNPLGPCYEVAGLAAQGFVSVKNRALVDAYDSRLGPYGGSNVEAKALISTNSTTSGMLEHKNKGFIQGDVLVGPGGDPGTVYVVGNNTDPAYSATALEVAVPILSAAPPAVGPSTGSVSYTTGPVSITSDMHVDAFTIDAAGQVTIDGDVIILCDGPCSIGGLGLVVKPGSRLRLYLQDELSVVGPCNDASEDPGRLEVYNLGTGVMTLLGQDAAMAGRVIAPKASFNLNQSAQFYGTFLGDACDLDNKAAFHMDLALIGTTSFAADMAGAQGVAGTGGITSAATFAEWFRDVLGVNQSAAHTIELTRNISGIYEYLDSDFRPIDDRLLGNDGELRNSHFTYAIKAQFVYEACTNQFIGVQGGDGTWIFIDGMLVVDLGGVVPITAQRFDLDRLGLEDGREYDLHLFHAQRQPFASLLRFWTNIELTTDGVVPSLTSVFD